MKTWGERIKLAREAANLTQEQLGEKLGVTGVTIMRYEKNQRQPRLGQLSKIAKALNTTVYEMMGPDWDGWSEIDTSDAFSIKKAPTLEDERKEITNVIPMPEKYEVPLIGDIACGRPILAVEEAEETVEAPTWVKADFALRCRGESMITARIFDGDIVYIRKQPNVDNGQIAAVRVGNEATLKKVYYNGQRLILRAANPLFPDLEYEGFELEDIEILGKAVAFTSMLQQD